MDPHQETQISYWAMKLRVEPSRIDRELIEHPEHYFHVAEQAALAQSRVAAEKEKLAKVEARLYRDIGAKKEEKGERVTETVLRNSIMLHSARQEQFDSLQHATQEAAQWSALRESFSSRGYILRDICQLTLAGFMSTQSVRGPAATGVREATSEANKARVTAKRNERWKGD